MSETNIEIVTENTNINLESEQSNITVDDDVRNITITDNPTNVNIENERVNINLTNDEVTTNVTNENLEITYSDRGVQGPPGSGGGSGTTIGLSFTPIRIVLTRDEPNYLVSAPVGHHFDTTLLVFVNGVKWRVNEGYTVSSSAVTFSLPLEENDEIEIFASQTINNVDLQEAADVVEIVPANPADPYIVTAEPGEVFSEKTIVWVNGIEWDSGDSSYTRTNTTITFHCPLKENDEIRVASSINFNVDDRTGGTGGSTVTISTDPVSNAQDARSINVDGISYNFASEFTLPTDPTAYPDGVQNINVDTTLPTDTTQYPAGLQNVNVDVRTNLHELDDINVAQDQRFRFLLNANNEALDDLFVPGGTSRLVVGSTFGALFPTGSQVVQITEFNTDGTRTTDRDGVVNPPVTVTNVQYNSINQSLTTTFGATPFALTMTLRYQVQVQMAMSPTPTIYEDGHQLVWNNATSRWITEEPGHIQWRSTSIYRLGDQVTFNRQGWIADVAMTTEAREPAADNPEWRVQPNILNQFPSVNIGVPANIGFGTQFISSGHIPADGRTDLLRYNATDQILAETLNPRVPQDQLMWREDDVPVGNGYGLQDSETGAFIGPISVRAQAEVNASILPDRFDQWQYRVDFTADQSVLDQLVADRFYTIGNLYVNEPASDNPPPGADGYALTWVNADQQWRARPGGSGTRAQQEIQFGGTVGNQIAPGDRASEELNFSGTTSSTIGTGNERFTIPVRTGFVNSSAITETTLVITGLGNDIDGSYTQISGNRVRLSIFPTINQMAVFQPSPTPDAAPGWVRSDNQRYLYYFNGDYNGGEADTVATVFANGSFNIGGTQQWIVFDHQIGNLAQPSTTNAFTNNAFFTQGFPNNTPLGSNFQVLSPNTMIPIQQTISVVDNHAQAGVDTLSVVFNYSSVASDTEIQDRRAILEGLRDAVNTGFSLTGANAWTLTFNASTNSVIDTQQTSADRYTIMTRTTYTPAGNGENAELTFIEGAGGGALDFMRINYQSGTTIIETDLVTIPSGDTLDASFITDLVSSINMLAQNYTATAGTGNQIILTADTASANTLFTITYTDNGGGDITTTSRTLVTGTGDVITPPTLTVDSDSIPITTGLSSTEVAVLVSQYVDNSDWINSVRAGNKATFTAVESGSQSQLPVVFMGTNLSISSTFTDGT